MVSRSHDRGKPLSVIAARHVADCGECRSFARSTESLSAALRAGSRELPWKSKNALNEKIISALAKERVERARIPRRRFMPVPAFAAVMLVVLVTAAVLFRVIPVNTPGPGNTPGIGLSGVIDTTNVLQGIAVKVESPIESELRSLEQSVKSAAQSLLSGLDPKIT